VEGSKTQIHVKGSLRGGKLHTAKRKEAEK
jgi:hypothetical protein